MRGALAILFLLAIGSTVDRARADPYRWCAEIGGRGGGEILCTFLTFKQCMWTVSGRGGFCRENIYYDGRPYVTPERAPRGKTQKPNLN
jgi:hypothetical protein